MPLPATIWAGQADAFASYLTTDAPLELTSVTPTPGTVVPFIHDEAGETAVMPGDSSGGLPEGTLAVCVRATNPLVVHGTYTYDGETWTVEGEERARAGVEWPRRYVLVRHVR